MSIYMAEYLIDFEAAACHACGQCVERCPLGALSLDPATGRPVADRVRCYGCRVCRRACSTGALFLVPRDRVPGRRPFNGSPLWWAGRPATHATTTPAR